MFQLWQAIILQNVASLYYMAGKILPSAESQDLAMLEGIALRVALALSMPQAAIVIA
jgi:hypothetical protein